MDLIRRLPPRLRRALLYQLWLHSSTPERAALLIRHYREIGVGGRASLAREAWEEASARRASRD